MKSPRLLFLLAIFIMADRLAAQGPVGIGTSTPHTSAMLDVTSNQKGILLPRLTTAQRDSISNPPKGLQVLNLDDLCTDIYDGTNWTKNCAMKAIGPGNLDPTHPGANSWLQKASFPFPRTEANGFSIAGRGYIANGYDWPNAKYEMYRFDPATNAWSQAANFPFTPRSLASVFVIGNTVYLVGGKTQTNTLLKDCWEYNATTNLWNPKANFPGSVRAGAFAFAINGKGYICSGEGAPSDLWQYDPATDLWITKTAPPFTARRKGFTFVIGDKAYLGTGTENSAIAVRQEVYEYNSITDSWTQKANFGGGIRSSAIGFSLAPYGYAGSGVNGGGSMFSDLWRYNPATDTWDARASFATRADAAAFTIGKKAYVGTGADNIGNERPEFYEYVEEPVTGTAYTTAPVLTNIDTYNNGTWTTSVNTIYNSNSGNVGIGTTTPSQKLEVVGGVRTTGLETNNLVSTTDINTAAFRMPTGAANNYVLKSDATGNASWVNVNTLSITETDPQVGTLSNGRLPKWNGSALVDGLLTDNGSGIGINTNAIHGNLQFPQGVANRKIVMHEDADNDHQFYGFGVNGSALRYQVPINASHVFISAINASSANELLRILSNGNVGIGTWNPLARLHVTGGGNTSPNLQRAYFHVATGGIWQDVSSSGNVVMRADGWIWANGGGFIATSDARIKNIIGKTNTEEDLNTLDKIEITDYRYKDRIAFGNNVQKKVVAQQVQQVYPIAVNKGKGIIPNVFEVAKSSKIVGESTVITTSKPHDFKTGDEVKFIFNKTGEQYFTVIVKDAYTFSIPTATTDDVFVYGKKIDDLLNVDYDALTTLNISATQQLTKEKEKMRAEFEKKIAELQKQLSVFNGK